MGKFLAIGLGGFFGAVLRYWISEWVFELFKGRFPAGTLTVNLIGSFVLGLLMAVFENYPLHPLQPNIKFFLATGLLGAFTTFSTFSFETLVLLQAGSVGKAALNILLSVCIGIAAALAGFWLGKYI